MSGGFDKGFSISPLAAGGGGGGGVPLNFSQTKGAQVTITAAEAKPATVVSTTITTQGNPVQIIVSGDANPSANGWGQINIYRDGTAVGQLVQFESSAANENVPYSLQVVDEPAAGTWTYSLKVTTVTTDTQFGEGAGPIITVTELGAEAAGVSGVSSVTASPPLASSGGANPDISITAGSSPGDVLTWDGSAWSGAAPTGGGTIGGTIAANEVAFGTALNTISGSGDLTFDGTSLKVISQGGGGTEFFEVDGNTISIWVHDSVAGNVDSVRISSVGVTVDSSAGSGNPNLVLETVSGTPKIIASAGSSALDLVLNELQVNGAPGAAGEVLTSNGPGSAPTWQAGGGGGSIGGSIETNEVAFGSGSNTISGSSSLTYNSTTQDLTVGDASPHSIRIGPYGYVSNPIIESLNSMNINIVDFGGALGIQAANNDLVLIGGDDGGGQSYLQTQPNVRLETQGRLLVKPATDGADAVEIRNTADVLLVQVDTSNKTTTITGDANPALVIASEIDGAFLQVTPTTYELAIFDPLTPTNTTTLNPSDVAVGDGSQSGNISAGRVGVTDTGTGNKLSLTVPGAVATLTSEDGASNPFPLNLVIEELQLNSSPGNAGEVLTSNGPNAAPTWQTATLSVAREVWVTQSGSDISGDGSVSAPFASIGAAMAAITTASPAERWAIRLGPGNYTEAGPIALKANVFIIGHHRRSTRVTSTGGWTLGASFTPAGDHRSGAIGLTMLGACTFDFSVVSSNEGKLYFDSCLFGNTVSLTGFSSINQGEMRDCDLLGNLTISGVNWATTGCIHRSCQVFLIQHSGNPTLLAATSGYADKITLTTTVNNFNRRCSLFSRSFWTDDLEVDGDVSYADLSIDSVPRYGIVTLNNGQVVNLNPLILAATSQGLRPDTDSSRYLGDFGNQWLFTFNYLNLSTGTDLYVGTTGGSYDPAGSTAGFSVYIQPDQYGIQTNVNGGLLDLRTAAASGTGVSGDIVVETGASQNGNSGDITVSTATPSGAGIRGEISLSARQIDASSSPLLHKWQSGATGSRPAGLAAGDVGRTYFDTTIGLPIWWNGSGWIDAAGTAR